mmetsp:Transcript_34411/g.85804  ORF Transcript_34411/g.85804 Transcript_34411/m.85804 type:complete len:228 (+) Transcript_34411:988-1671(+)
MQVGDLPDHLDRVREDAVELLEERQGLPGEAEPLAHQPQVVDGLDAVRVRPHGLLVHPARELELFAHEEDVALVHQRLGVVPVVPHCQVCVLDCGVVVTFVKVDEGQVGRRARHQLRVFFLVRLERFHCPLELARAHEVQRLGDLQLIGERGVVGVAQLCYSPVEARAHVLLDSRREQLCSDGEVFDDRLVLLAQDLLQPICAQHILQAHCQFVLVLQIHAVRLDGE